MKENPGLKNTKQECLSAAVVFGVLVLTFQSPYEPSAITFSSSALCPQVLLCVFYVYRNK